MKKIISLLLALAMIFALTACGDSTQANANNDVSETPDIEKVEEKTAEFFDENPAIPKPESICDCQYKSKTTTTANDNVTFSYVADDIDALLADYSQAISQYGLSINEEVGGIVSIIQDDMVVAELSIEDGRMKLVLLAENDRVSATVEELSVGDTITTNDVEFTVNSIDFSYEVKPTDTHSVYSSYQADSGKVYIDVKANIKNLMQRDIRVEELPTVTAVYDGKYPYEGFTVVDTGNSFDWAGSYIAANPLETVTIHCIVDCPEEVSTSGKSVTLTFHIGQEVYEYTMR